jgi:hypothetical protein
MARLTADQWRVIRQVWEYDPDQPSYLKAAGRAAAKYGFKPPSKAAIGKRVKVSGWERRGSLSGINQAAHRIADRLGAKDEHKPPSVQGGGSAIHDPAARPDSVVAEHEERRAAELRRAEIRVRHRKEWQRIAVLRQEALKHRNDDLDQTFHLLKITKIAAETTMLQQTGECRAWGLDELLDSGRLKSLTDEQLEAIVAGKKLS